MSSISLVDKNTRYTLCSVYTRVIQHLGSWFLEISGLCFHVAVSVCPVVWLWVSCRKSCHCTCRPYSFLCFPSSTLVVVGFCGCRSLRIHVDLGAGRIPEGGVQGPGHGQPSSDRSRLLLLTESCRSPLPPTPHGARRGRLEPTE